MNTKKKNIRINWKKWCPGGRKPTSFQYSIHNAFEIYIDAEFHWIPHTRNTHTHTFVNAIVIAVDQIPETIENRTISLCGNEESTNVRINALNNHHQCKLYFTIEQHSNRNYLKIIFNFDWFPLFPPFTLFSSFQLNDGKNSDKKINVCIFPNVWFESSFGDITFHRIQMSECGLKGNMVFVYCLLFIVDIVWLLRLFFSFAKIKKLCHTRCT